MRKTMKSNEKLYLHNDFIEKNNCIVKRDIRRKERKM